jgi:RNA polymerase sigma factor (sigma-70 family)
MATGRLSEVVQHLRRAVLPCTGAGRTDGQLLEDFLNHREDALAALVRRHGPMVWGVCRRVLCNHHDAEDAFQATFFVLVRKAASIVPREMVANWLYGVAHQTALKARAVTAKRRARERQVPQMPEPVTAEHDLWRDLQPLLDQELSRLPDSHRAVIVLCDLQGRTRKEAAGQLGLPEGTVASRLARARTMLAKRLARQGVVLSGGALVEVLSQKVLAETVPTFVLTRTIQAASLVATGQATAGVISSQVAALAEGVLKTMLLTKLKTLMVGMVGLLALGLGLFLPYGFAQPAVKQKLNEPAKRALRQPALKDADKPNQKADAGKSDDKKSNPHYCWLVFGPKAKVKALVRLDGEEVAIDRDGDGKFDSKGERFKSEKDCKDVVIADPDGKTSYVITSVHVLHVVPPEKFLEVRVHIRGTLKYPQACIIQLADRPKGAPQAHFHGPLTIAPKGWRIADRASLLLDLGPLLPQPLKQLAGKGIGTESTLPKSLQRTGEPTDLCAAILTKGKSSFVAVCSPDDTQEGRREKSPFPRGIHPMVDVEFPAKKPGDPPIKKRYPLDQFCCDGGFRGPVRVPEEAGTGKARVTFSFDAWKGAKVAPTTVEIPVEDLQEEKKGDKAPKEVKGKLECTWTVLSVEVQGQKVYDLAKVPAEKKIVVIRDGKFVLKQGDKTEERPFQIDPAKKPKQIDLFLPSLVMGQKVAWRGIYSLEGDTLTACFDLSLQTRPSEFTTKAGDQRRLWILKRTLPPAQGKKEEVWSKTLPLNLGKLERYPPEFIYTPKSEEGKKSKTLQLQGELKLDKEC